MEEGGCLGMGIGIGVEVEVECLDGFAEEVHLISSYEDKAI